jgi:hypothetical protein
MQGKRSCGSIQYDVCIVTGYAKICYLYLQQTNFKANESRRDPIWEIIHVRR